MGARSGKFIVPHTETKVENCTTDTHPEKPTDAEVSVLISNGVVMTYPDVPSIDEIVESNTGECPKLENGHAESVQHTETIPDVNQVNGDLPCPDDNTGSKLTKKHSNPILWFKRRISKKSNSFKCTDKTTEEPGIEIAQKQEVETAPSEEVEVSNHLSGIENDQSISLVANDLVHEVILSATSAHLEETKNDSHEEQIEINVINPSDNLQSHPLEPECEQSVSEPVVQTEIIIPVRNHEIVLNGVVNGDDSHNYQIEDPILDSNNTNVICEDAISSKLASLELVNGHHVEMNGVHCDAQHTIMNGEGEHLDLSS